MVLRPLPARLKPMRPFLPPPPLFLLLLPLLLVLFTHPAASDPAPGQQPLSPPVPLPLRRTPHAKRFTLRHIYAEAKHPTLGKTLAFNTPTEHDMLTTFSSARDLIVDVAPADYPTRKLFPPGDLAAFKNVTTNGDLRDLLDHRSYTMDSFDNPWEDDFECWPNVTSNRTLLSLASMAGNAYLDPVLSNTTDWYELESGWPLNMTFGFEEDGIRGHVFYSGPDAPSDDNSTDLQDDVHYFVVAIKGTTAAFLGSGGPTAKRDQLNDNRLFSCCCARVGYTWTPVCDCYSGDSTCKLDCLENSLRDDNLFYAEVLRLYLHLSTRYPNAKIWMTGHSLGGALSSLIAQTFGFPTVTFSSPGELMATRRLHLPGPPALPFDRIPLWHVGHTADPIFMGVCQGPTSSCWFGGYAMESRCHSGNVIVYDTVGEWGWRVNIQTHRVRDFIEGVIIPWEEKGLRMPEPVVEDGCEDCGAWMWE